MRRRELPRWVAVIIALSLLLLWLGSCMTGRGCPRSLRQGQLIADTVRVTAINGGEPIANVELDANGVQLVASITVEVPCAAHRPQTPSDSPPMEKLRPAM